MSVNFAGTHAVKKIGDAEAMIDTSEVLISLILFLIESRHLCIKMLLFLDRK